MIWFSATQGYGFIRPEDPAIGKDMFVHFHHIVMRDFKTLNKDDLVEFSVGENKNGPCAKDVKLLEAAE